MAEPRVDEHAHAHDDHGHDDHDDHAHGGHDHGPDDHGHDHPGGVRGFVTSLFRPHSHDAADSVDAALESSEQGIRAVKTSLVALGVWCWLGVWFQRDPLLGAAQTVILGLGLRREIMGPSETAPAAPT